MTEKQFLANFKKHLEIGKKGLFKSRIIRKINNGYCPIGCGTCRGSRDCDGPVFCPPWGIKKRVGGTPYQKSCEYYNDHSMALASKMIAIVKQTKWRK